MRSRRSPLVHAAQGLLMGSADVVPGVSGGTVALILGIYTRLIHAIRTLAGVPVALLHADVADARRRGGEVEWAFVLPLGVGILTAFGVGSVVLPPLLEAHPARMHALFFGLVAASVAVPWRRIERPGAPEAAVLIVAAVLAFVLVGLPPATVTDPHPVQVFAAAAVAISAMILPGVSGAFLLKALGLYEVTLAALRGLDVVYVTVFALGAAVGLGSFAKLLEVLLARRHDLTMAGLVGLMVGSLRALWPWQDADRTLLAPPAEPVAVAVTVAVGLVGYAVVRALMYAGAGAEDDAPVG